MRSSFLSVFRFPGGVLGTLSVRRSPLLKLLLNRLHLFLIRFKLLSVGVNFFVVGDFAEVENIFESRVKQVFFIVLFANFDDAGSSE